MAIRRVPTDFATLQLATNAAAASDTIVVEAAYANTNENVSVSKEGLTYDGVAGNGVVTLTLAAGILNVTLTGAANFRVTGNTSANTISGNSGNNVLNGGAGNDSISGGDGNDTIDGGADNDILRGGNGDDAVTDTAGTIADIDVEDGNDTVSIATTFTSGSISGGLGNDTLSIAGAANLSLINISGFEWLRTGGAVITGTASQFDAFDRIFSTPATLTASVSLTLVASGAAVALDLSDELNDGGPRGVVLVGSNDSETITTGGGNDNVNGGNGNDVLTGGAGNDTLAGGAGDDAIYGGAGNDIITGDASSTNAGNDILRGEDGDDAITDNFGAVADIDAGIGNDTVTLSATFTSGTVAGGADNDTLVTAGAANLSLLNISGFERLQTNNFSLTGTAAQFDSFDRIYTTLAAPNATVTLTLIASNGPVTLDLSDELNDGGPRGVILLGSDDSETITAGDGADNINGGNGNDVLFGGGGGDTLNGGAGNDIISGGLGNDTIIDSIGDVAAIDAGGDNDTVTIGSNFTSGFVQGGDGNDVLTLATNFDFTAGVSVTGFEILAAKGKTVTGRASDFQAFGTIYYDSANANFTIPVNLVLSATGAPTTLDLTTSFGNGGVRAVNMTGTSDDETLTLTSGNDTLVAGGGNDNIQGAAGRDTIDGGAGSDTLNGGAGNDTLSGGADNDIIDGGADNDSINGGAGFDTLFGGDGIDTVIFSDEAQSIKVSLATQTATTLADIAIDSMSGFENVTGSAFNDILTGDAGANVIDGGSGDDLIDGGLGNDTLNGGNGNDTLTYASSSAAVNVNLTTGVTTGGVDTDRVIGFEKLIGSAFDDVLTGSAAILMQSMRGGSGNDIIQSRTTFVDLYGEDGNDTFVFDLKDFQTVAQFGQAIGGKIDGGAGSNEIYIVDTNLALGSSVLYFGGLTEVRNIQRIDVSSQESIATVTDLTFDAGQFASGELPANMTLAGAIGTVNVFFFEYYDGPGVANVDLSQITYDNSGLNGDLNFHIFDNPRTTIAPSNQNNIIIGSAFDDLIESEYGHDTIDGKGGTDTVKLSVALARFFGASSSPAIDFLMNDLTTPAILRWRDDPFNTVLASVVNVENIHLDGLNGADHFVTLDGADVLFGGGGNDIIDSGGGSDFVNGGAGDDILTGGAGADSIQGDIGNDTITFDAADVTVDGGAGNDTGIFSGANTAAGRAYNMALHGFERLQWTDAGNTYNMVLNGDGTRTETVVDTAHTESTFASRTTKFDASGVIDFIDIVDDVGKRTFNDLDNLGNQSWTQYFQVYDVNGAVDFRDFRNDNSTRLIVDEDNLNNQGWTQIQQVFDALGREDYRDYRLDNGTRQINDYDQAGNQSWTDLIQLYDSLGREDYRDYRLDNGTRQLNDYDQDSSQTWTEAIQLYDTLGREDYRDYRMDNGNRVFIDNDQDNTQSWTRWQKEYLTVNDINPFRQVITYDNGTVLTI